MDASVDADDVVGVSGAEVVDASVDADDALVVSKYSSVLSSCGTIVCTRYQVHERAIGSNSEIIAISFKSFMFLA